MAKRIFFIVVALLLIASALAAIPTAIIETMEWARVHFNLIRGIFDGYFKDAFYGYFDYGMIKAHWLSATLNYLNYNISMLFDYVFIGLELVGGVAIAIAAVIPDKKKKNKEK